MKHILFALVPSLLLACNPRVSRPSSDSQTVSEAASIETTAADSLFIDDVVDSATDGSEEMPADGDDQSAEEDTKGSRLEKMAADLLAELDSDDSKTLSEDEYLGILDEKIEGKELSEKAIAKATEKLKAEFAKHVGSDSELSAEELQSLLKSQAGRVGKHRCHKHKNQHKNRLKKNLEEIMAKYDKNGDGKVDKSELEALLKDKKQCHKKKKKKGGNEGKGGDNANGGDEGENEGGDDVIVIPPTDGKSKAKG